MTQHELYTQLKAVLEFTRLNTRIDFHGISIVPELSKYGCSGCVFESGGKANGCSYKSVCMAHIRKDRNSIVFTPK